MRRVLIGAGVLAVCGCGKGNLSKGLDLPALVGPYRGTYELPHSGINGDAVITFGSSGNLTGALIDRASNTSESIKGTLNESGQFVGSSTYPGESKNVLRGTFKLLSPGKLEGHLVERRGTSSGGISIFVSRN